MPVTGATQTQLNQTSTAQQQLQTEQESGSKWLCVNVFHGVRSIFGRKCNVLVNTIAFIAASTVALGSLALEPVNRLYILCTGKPLYQRKCSVISAERVQKKIPLSEPLKKTEDEAASLKDEAASLKDKVAALETEVTTANLTIKEKGEQLSALTEELQDNKKQYVKLDEFCAKKEIEVRKWEAIGEIVNGFQQQTFEVFELYKQKNKLIGEQRTELTRLNDELKTALNKAQNELAGVEQELGVSTEQVNFLNKKLLEINEESMTLEDELRRTEAQLDHTVSQHKAEVETYSAEIDGLRQSLAAKEDEVREITARLADEQCQLKLDVAQRAKVDQEHSALMLEKSNLSLSLERAGVSIAELKTDKLKIKEQLGEQAAELAEKNKEIEELSVTIDQKNAEISQLEFEKQGLEEYLRDPQMNNLAPGSFDEFDGDEGDDEYFDTSETPDTIDSNTDSTAPQQQSEQNASDFSSGSETDSVASDESVITVIDLTEQLEANA
ncbi:hypothetical protein [uncultured Endozoicomonas sp.]|uniref:hypothetical protein n=1 Tax=uncultured Endozoicomonas sp. TaxID=432652 RepID=UPI002614549A|nr:hypothetical protein [uncultured Endozoicomonas sp.]